MLATCGADQTEWLLTEEIPGLDATRSALRADPATLVPLLAAGLRQIHATPWAECPFPNGIDRALAQARRRVRDGLVGREDLHPEFRHLSYAAALAELDRLRPDAEDLAVATWSVTWNIGPGIEDLFLDSYGIERDQRAETFYRLLYDLES